MISAVAGTFDVLHDGHKALIRRAFEVADKVIIGITSDAMASGSRDEIVSIHLRRKAVEAFVHGMGDCEIMEIDDMFGGLDRRSDVDILVVSEETLDNGRAVNDRRIRNGLKPLELSVVPLVMADDGSKISARSIMKGAYGHSGRSDVMDIAVGSANRVKVEAVRSVMERIYGDVRITAVEVDSGVPSQPFEGETHIGSENRARAALGDHDMAVGIEAGVFEMLDGLYDIQHCTIITKDGRATYGHGSGFRYPDVIADEVRNGLTVGDAMKKVYGNTEIGKKQGAIGFLSNGLIDRKALTEQSVTAAMIPRLRGD